MKNPVFRTALLYAILAGAFILVDLALDRLIGGPAQLDVPHLILAAAVVLISFIVLNRAMQMRRRAQAVLRQAHDELEIRVQERTQELARANQALQAGIAARERIEQERERLLAQVERARQSSEELANDLKTANTELQKRTHDLGERIKELKCLYDISDLFARPGIALEERLQGTVGLVRQGWQYPDIACAQIILEGQTFRTGNWQDSTWKQTSDIVVYGERAGAVEVCYLEERPAGDEGPFLKEERDLINAIADQLGKITQRERLSAQIQQERERIQELARTLQAERDILDAIMEHTQTDLAYLDPEFNFVQVNTAYARDSGHSKQELVGRNHFELFPNAENQAIFEQVRDTGQPVEYRAKPFEFIDQPERGITYWDWTLSPIKTGQDQVRGLVLSLVDVTEQKRAEAQIRHLSSFPQMNPNPILEIDAAGAIIFHNSAATKTLERLGMEEDVRAFLPDDLFMILRELEQKKETRFYREVQIGGATFAETVHLVPQFNAVRIYATDITELKRVEQDLRHAFQESQQRQAEVTALLAGSRAVMEHREFKDAARAIYTSCKDLVGATGGYLALLSEDGARNEPILLDSGDLPCTVDPSLPMPVRGLREQTYRLGRAVYDNDFRNSPWTQLLPDGHACLDNVLFAPLAIKGLVVGLIGLANKPGGFTDNDARLATAFGELAAIALFNNRTIEMLENSEERFRSVAQTASDAIISYNSQGNVVFWNNAAEKIFGYSSAEMLGQPFTAIMPLHIREAHERDMRMSLVSDTPTIPGRIIETTGLRRNGSQAPIELSLAAWQTREGRFYTSIIRDITERKKSEAALQQAHEELAQRIHERTMLEERQRLARELHDSVSQALYGISLGAHTALTLLDSDRDKVLEALNYVLSLAQAGLAEMRALIFDLRPESLAMEGLVTALAKQTAALRARHGLQVSLEPCQEPDLPLDIKEALYRIAQEALQNAIKHARPARLQVKLICEQASMTLEVSDDGLGFDPTAEYPGHLGLRSMRERAERLGGILQIESTPGHGTRVRAHIPLAASKESI